MAHRHSSLTVSLLRHVSGAALHVSVVVSPRAQSEVLSGPIGFLARLSLWIKLVFGFSSEAAEARAVSIPYYKLSRAQVRANAHWQKRRASAYKHSVRDLNILMYFVPDSRGRGLRLHQYRERLARLSVVGRLRIYAEFLSRRISLHRSVSYRVTLCGAMGSGHEAMCQAPLRPD